MKISSFVTFSYGIVVFGVVLSIVGWCLIRNRNRIRTPQRLHQIARICVVIGVLKVICAILEFTYARQFWWGIILLLFSLFWFMRANRARRAGNRLANAYQPFPDGHNQQNNNNNNNNQLPIQTNDNNNNSHSNVSTDMDIVVNASEDLHQPMILADEKPEIVEHQRLIRNAVPPSPFLGVPVYSQPSIPMLQTKRGNTLTDNGYRGESPIQSPSNANANANSNPEPNHSNPSESKVENDNENKRNNIVPENENTNNNNACDNKEADDDGEPSILDNEGRVTYA